MDTLPATSKSSHTRRRVLGWGSAGVIGGLASYWGWPHGPSDAVIAAAKPRPTSTPPEIQYDSPPSEILLPVSGICREDFLPHLKSVFHLDATTRCTLIEVGDTQKLVSSTAEFTSFSLLFAASATFVPDSKIYQLSHRHLRSMEFFLSPVGRSKDQMHLEAVISQRV